MHATTSKAAEVVKKEYEFDAAQNRLIADLSTKMRWVGYFWIFMSTLLLLAGLSSGQSDGFLHVIPGVMLLVVGIWTEKAARSFQLVVESQGHDIRNLVDALSHLQKLLSLQFWVLVAAILAFVCTSVLIHLA